MTRSSPVRLWDRTPLLYKVLIGNGFVIIGGALSGTVLTDMVSDVSGIALAFVFAGIGILLSLVINYWILRNALYPMSALQHTVERIDRGDTAVRAPLEQIHDPQLRAFAQALNTMLARLAAHTRMLESHRAQLRHLSGQVLSAQEEERKRIARELHDDTSGSLARVLLNVEMCEDTLPENMCEMRERMRGTRLIAEQALENVRKMIFDLRPTLLDDLGLVAAVRWYAKNNLEPAGIAVQVESSSHLGRATPQIETAMFRIAQEAITNVVRHSGAHQSNLQLLREKSHWKLVVQDDGCGFDVEASNRVSTEKSDHRWGLFGMKERVELLGGTLHIESFPGIGTTLTVEIPVE